MFFIQNGRPTYFDVSVCSTTQPSHISSSASCDGMAAAAAGEVAKDAKYLAMVEKRFYSIMCGIFFRVWTPFALSTFNSIADRTTTQSGISWKLARKNLLQQLSRSLRMNNARTVLRYWALQM